MIVFAKKKTMAQQRQVFKTEYNAKLDGNILVIGPTHNGKTSLRQQWAVNNFFGENIENVYWTSSLRLSSTQKNEIYSYFENVSLKFAQVNDRDNLEMFIEDLKKIADANSSNDNVEVIDDDKTHQNLTAETELSSLGEHNSFKSLVIFDDMSTIANKSNAFSYFLTVSRKYGYTCVYILHNLMQNNSDIWQLILANTNIIVLFKSLTISSPIVNILYQNAVHNTSKYIPRQDLWLFNVYKDLYKISFSYTDQQQQPHLMIDNRPENDKTLGRFRAATDSRDKQICFCPSVGDDRRYVKYWASPIKKDSNIFKIKEITGTTICSEKYKRSYVNDNINFNEGDTDINSDSFDKKIHLASKRQGERTNNNSDESTNNSSSNRSDRREVYGNGQDTRKRPRFITTAQQSLIGTQ